MIHVHFQWEKLYARILYRKIDCSMNLKRAIRDGLSLPCDCPFLRANFVFVTGKSRILSVCLELDKGNSERMKSSYSAFALSLLAFSRLAEKGWINSCAIVNGKQMYFSVFCDTWCKLWTNCEHLGEINVQRCQKYICLFYRTGFVILRIEWWIALRFKCPSISNSFQRAFNVR